MKCNYCFKKVTTTVQTKQIFGYLLLHLCKKHGIKEITNLRKLYEISEGE